MLVDLGDVAYAEGYHADAATLCADSLSRSWAQRDQWSAAGTLTVLACLPAEAGSPERAVRLLGAAVHLRELAGASVLIGVQADYIGAVDRTRDALGQSAFQAAWAGGRLLEADQRIAEVVAMGEELGRNAIETCAEAASDAHPPAGVWESTRDLDVSPID